MKDEIQYKKAEKKINLLKNHILGLSHYNSIVDYYNTKQFNITINYFQNDNECCYYYDINIYRGTHEPKKTFSTSLQYKEKIYDLISDLINSLINNDSFNYFSIKNNENFNYKEFAICLKTGICVNFSIKDEEDKKFFDDIIKTNKKIVTIKSKETKNITSDVKDLVQIEKAKQIIENINNIFNDYCEINSIDNYDNKKPIKLLITLDNCEKIDCEVFNFKIVRGTINPEVIMEYNLSIKETSIIYSIIYDIINNYNNKDIYIYSGMNNSESYNKYTLYLKNMLSIEFVYYKEKDKQFFNNIFNNKISFVEDTVQKKLELKNNN